MDENNDHHEEPSPSERDGSTPQLAPERVDHLELVEPSMWTRGMTLMAVLLVSAGLWFHDFIWSVLQAPQVPLRLYAMVLGPPLLFLIYVLWRWWETPKEPRQIVFHDNHVSLPVSTSSRRSVELPYEEVSGVLGMSRGATQSLLIDTGSKTIGYSQADLARDDGLRLLKEELLRRIHQLPNADEVIGAMRRRQKLARIATSKPITLTKALLGILAAYFAVELWMGVANDALGLIELGANAPALIDRGQYFRLISANFLHQGWIHIILNGIALLFLGGAVEKLVGPWRMLLIYLIGAIAGSLGSYLAGPGAVSVGSSTAIFGLFGAFLVLHLRYWNQLTPPFRQSLTWWVVIIGLNAGLPVVVPIIDYMAHLTGFIGGGVSAWLLLLPLKELKPDRRASMPVKIITGLVSLVFVAGLAQAALYAIEGHPRDDQRVFASMLEQARQSDSAADGVNRIAWVTAINEEASRAQLEEAREAVEAVMEDNPDRLDIRDTLATVTYRLAQKSTGQRRLELIDEAIVIERAVLDEAQPGPEMLGGGKATYASQLARFLSYRREIEGAIVRDALFEEAPEVSFDPGDDGGTFAVEAPTPAQGTARIYAVARVEGQVEGLVQTCLAEGEQQREVDDHPALERWPNNVRILVGLVEPADTCRQDLEFWPMTAEIRELP